MRYASSRPAPRSHLPSRTTPSCSSRSRASRCSAPEPSRCLPRVSPLHPGRCARWWRVSLCQQPHALPFTGNWVEYGIFDRAYALAQPKDWAFLTDRYSHSAVAPKRLPHHEDVRAGRHRTARGQLLAAPCGVGACGAARSHVPVGFLAECNSGTGSCLHLEDCRAGTFGFAPGEGDRRSADVTHGDEAH